MAERPPVSPLKRWALRVGLALAACALLGGAFLFAAPALFDFAVWQQHVARTLKDATGQDVRVEGTTGISLIPEPMIVFTDVAGVTPAAGHEAAATPFASFRIPRLEVRLGWAHLFSQGSPARRLVLNAPELTLAGTSAFPLTSVAGALRMIAQAGAGSSYVARLDVENGSIRASGVKEPVLSDIFLQIPLAASGAPVQLSGAASQAGVPFSFTMNLNAGTPETAARMEATLSWPGQAARFEGSPGDAAAGSGKISVKSEDFSWWWQRAGEWFGRLPPLRTPVSGEFSANLTWNAEGAVLDDVIFSAGRTQAAGRFRLPVGSVKGSAEIAFSGLDLDPWQGAGSDAGQTAPAFVIPPAASVSLNVTAKEIYLRGQTLSDAAIEGELGDGALTINRAEFGFPGSGEALFIGIVQPRDGGASLDGRFEIKGESLLGLNNAFSFVPFRLEEAQTGRYRTAGNVFASSREVRISEMRLLLDNQQCVGSLVFYLENPVRVEGALGLKTLDFDRWTKAVRMRSRVVPAVPKEGDPAEQFDYSWLTDMPWDVSLNLRTDDVTYRTLHADTASFRIRVKPGELAVSGLATTLGGVEFTGDFSLDARNSRPHVQANLNGGEVDAAWWNRILYADAAPVPSDKAVADETWSRAQWRFPFLAAHDGAVKLAFRQVSAGGIFLTGAVLDSELSGGAMTIRSLSGGMWDGKLDFSGTLGGGAVPSLSGKISLAGISLARFFGNWTRLASLDGIMSANGSLSMSGLTPHNWVSGLSGNLTMNGRNALVSGFDLPSIVQAVAAVRSVSDIINITRLSFPGGKTVFPAFQGLLNAEQGKLSFVNFTFANELARGKVDGEISLPEWKINAVTTLELPTLGQDEHPSLQFHMTGPADAPETRLDTSLLEAYVARVAAQRMMNKPLSGTQ